MNQKLLRCAALLGLAAAGCDSSALQAPDRAAPKPQEAALDDAGAPLKPLFLSHTQGEVWNLFGDQIVRKVASQDTNGAYAIIESIIQPGGGPPPHIHHDEEELFTIQEGEFELRCGQDVHTGGPGTIAFMPRNLPHGFRNSGKTPGKIFTVISPGHFEGFFVEVWALPEADRGDLAKVTAIAAKYHLEFLPPPGAAPPGAPPKGASPPGTQSASAPAEK